MAISEEAQRCLTYALANPEVAKELLILLDQFASANPAAMTTDLKPSVSGSVSVGTQTKAFSAVYLRDRITGDVWRIEVENGVFQVETA